MDVSLVKEQRNGLLLSDERNERLSVFVARAEQA
jgi:hypothetical protein